MIDVKKIEIRINGVKELECAYKDSEVELSLMGMIKACWMAEYAFRTYAISEKEINEKLKDSTEGGTK